MTDLKPCPFCGGKIIKLTSPLKNTQMFVCHKCGADVCFYCAEYEPKASKAWNRRAETVKDQPDGDVVEVVRCKDCAFSREFKIWEKESQYEGFLKCECNMFRNNGKVVFDKHYCSFGERKDGDDT